MNLVKRTAMITLVSFLPLALGCSASSSDGNDGSDGTNPPAAEATVGAALTVAGADSQTNRPFTSEEIKSVVENQASFTVDGVATTDFAKVLGANRVEIDKGNGQVAALVRNGSRLELEGSKAGVAVEIDGAKFSVVSDAGRWDCLLTGLDATSESKLAGAMTLGVLLALDEDLAAQAEAGRCEIACVTILAFAIVVGVGIIAATTAFIVCETTGQARCERLAATQCQRGAKKVTKVCDAIAAAAGVFKNGKIQFKGSCRIECK